MQVNIGTWMANRRHPAGESLAKHGDALAVEVAAVRNARYERVLAAAKAELGDRDIRQEMARDITASFVMTVQDEERNGKLRPSQVLRIANDRITHRVKNFETWTYWVEFGYPDHHLDEELALAIAMAWIKED